MLVNAIHVGIHTGRELLHDAIPWTGMHMCNVVLLVAFAALRVVTMALIFIGLLSIGAGLDNPMGGDPSDLPVRFPSAPL